MKYFAEDKDDLYSTVFAELKSRGVKVPKVKKFKSSIHKQEKSNAQSKSKIFGISLNDQEWISDDECILPKFIASSTAYLRKHTKEVGLFRKAGSVARQRDLRAKLENGGGLEGSEPNDVASLLKQWLRELSEPLIPYYMHDLFIRCQQLEEDENRLNSILLTCLLLPPDHLHTLKHLLHFLFEFAADSDKNKMGPHNLALIMTPNIFVLGTDSVDKTSNTLVQQQTSVIQLLIENAEKIGEIPASVSFQQSIQDFKSGSELDSSGDILDYSPSVSTKKKKSGGPVQDIFSGIRKKLVGQNATPASKLDTPEKFQNARTPLPRSASKRKADPEQQSFCAVKKQATSAIGEGANGIETPKNKGTQNFLTVNGKSGGNHTRKKSFGLLRRKEKKRQKSSSSSSFSKGSLSLQGPLDGNVDKNNTEATSQVPVKSNDCAFAVNSPVFNFCPENVLKIESIKKSTSDCYLTTPCKNSVFFSTSSSHGCLQVRPRTSPYNLRSEKKSIEKENSPGVQNREDTLAGVQLNLSASKTLVSPLAKISVTPDILKEAKASLMTKKHSNIEKSSSSKEVQSLVTEGTDKVRNEPRRKSLREKDDHKSNLSKPHLESKQIVQGNNKKSGADSKFTELSLKSKEDNLPGKRSSNGDFRSSQRNGITRQEAFIVKSKRKLKEALDQVENPVDNSNEMNKGSSKNRVIRHDAEEHPLRKSQSVSLEVDKKHKSSRKVTKKTSRKGSLIRGRPNTVKSGLCQRFNADSSIVNNADSGNLLDKDNKNEMNLSVSTFKPLENAQNQSIHIHEDSIFSDLLDMSLNLKFEHFSLTSTSFTFEDEPKTDILIIPDYDNVVPDKKTPKQKRATELDVSLKPMTRSEKRLSLQVDKKRVSSHSDSKIPRLRSSVDVRNNSYSEPMSDPKRKVPRSKRSGVIDSEKIPAGIPVICPDSPSGLSTLQISMNDSCFKTPSRNPTSPGAEVWVSGRKFLGLQTPQEDDSCNNKRESIAMILRSKPGHVQAKVSMYDTKVRDSVYVTRSVPSYSTPTAPFSDLSAQNNRSQKQRSGSQKSKKQLSCSKSYDSSRKMGGKSRRSPLPPPPKFMMTPSPNTSHPLKEVTNISFGPNGSRNSLNNSLLKDDDSTLKSVPEANSNLGKNQLKLKRNSFSGNTPYKLSKKVARSESSPCPRPHNRVIRLKEESTSNNPLSILENEYWKESFPIKGNLPRTPVSKSSSVLSLEKLRSDQMVDEWQVEM